jgi:hypothetical protein
MQQQTSPQSFAPDPSAVFGAAVSLWQACHEVAQREPNLDPSECYDGMDQLMREIMRIAELFENWSYGHIRFEDLDDVWPYSLQDRFGEACLGALSPSALAEFDELDCLRIAMRMGLPLRRDRDIPIPIDVSAANPIESAGFKEFRIRSIRDSHLDDDVVIYTLDDEPWDENFGPVFYALYGVDENGSEERIADRPTFMEAVDLVRKLAPGIEMPGA